jgi:transcriptional regulator with XRE-family HTH domain
MSTTSDILKWLVDNYHEELRLKPWGHPGLIAELARRARVSINTIKNICNGTVASPRIKSLKGLTRVFGEARDLTQLDAPWFFDSSLEIFQARLKHATGRHRFIRIDIPDAGFGRSDQEQRRLARWLPGVYVTYRYSFERSREFKVAREVMHIKREADTSGGHPPRDTFSFVMSFLPGGGDEHEEVEFFEGVALPLENSIFFAGWDTRRGRSLFWYRSAAAEWSGCRFGILTSTRYTEPYYPVSACTVCIKADHIADNEVHDFMVKVTKIRPFDEIVPVDFGEKAVNAMRISLDNTPAEKDADGKPVDDAVLSLNLDRFARRLPSLVQEARTEKRGPFAAGWKSTKVPAG